MSSVPEGNVVSRRVDKLMLHAFAFHLAHTCKPERIKLLCAGVVRIVTVGRVGGRAEKRSLRDESTVDECDILQRLALYGD